MQADSIKIILSKIKNIFSQINPQYYETKRVGLLNSNQSYLNHTITILQEFQQFIQEVFPNMYRPMDQYEKLQKMLQNKQAQIRNYIRVQQVMLIKQENLEVKISGLEKVLSESKEEKENMRRQCDKLKREIHTARDRQPSQVQYHPKRVLGSQNYQAENSSRSKYSIRNNKNNTSKQKEKTSHQQTNSSINIGKSVKNYIQKKWN